MRSTFGHHYLPPDKGQLEAALASDAIVAFDTNVLLNLYQASQSVRDSFFRVLDALGDRLLLPHQVGVEYHRNRVKAIQDIDAEYNALIRKGEELADAGRNFAQGRERRDADSVDDVRGLIKEATESLRLELEKRRDQDPHRVEPSNDHIRDRLEDAFDGHVGRAPKPRKLARLVRDFVEVRVPLELPPGFEDAKRKSDPARAAGDYLIWEELLACAKRREQDVIFVTDDIKPDWWRKGGNGSPTVPHPSLVSEFAASTGYDYFQLTTSQLLKKAAALDVDVSDADVEEVEAIQAAASAAEAALEQQLREMREIYSQALDYKAITGLNPDISRSFISRIIGDEPLFDFVPKIDLPVPKDRHERRQQNDQPEADERPSGEEPSENESENDRGSDGVG
ncbi:PIN domain-containing protein [Isoptericola croceus]|uniref:PIN domain-containing protein n=1 Tax=Isoptericola croceus TaxID=3031406 RepID=UPI0023F676E3|nr:PIN domain-containing protein [Isoptericola croceus]